MDNFILDMEDRLVMAKVLDRIETPVCFPVTHRALVAASDESYAEDLQTAFDECGFEVTKTSSGAEAMALVEEDSDKFDFVFCDEHLDDMDGFTLASSIHPILKTLFRTVYTCSPSRELQMRLRARFLVPKPVKARNVEQLIERVRKNMRAPVRRKVRSMIRAFPADGVWAPEVHYKFVAAIHVLGEQACPKSIMEFMNVGELSEKDVENQLERYKAQAIQDVKV